MKILLTLLWATSGLFGASAQCFETSSISWKYAPSMKDGGLTSFVIANGFTRPRGIRWINDTLLVVDVGVGLVALQEKPSACPNGWMKSVLVESPELNHGLLINGTRIYASSVETVYRYQWSSSTGSISGREPVVTGMGLPGNHKTRTLDMAGQYLIVSSGSSENLETQSLDPSHGTAQIRRFGMNSTMPTGGYTWFQGDVVAWGMRNAVALAVSQDSSKLWTVENSADQLNYTSGSQLIDIHLDNPAEELNLVDLSDIGHSYGYPTCFTAWNMKGVVPGSLLELGDQFSIAPNVTDAQCANATFNKPPRLSMQAHSAPLDIVFYNSDPSNSTVAVKPEYRSHAFVSFHGSWNRDPPTGYGIVRIPWSGDGPSAEVDSDDGYNFVLQADLGGCPDRCLRPVGLAFDSKGRLFGSSDSTGEIFVVQATGTSPQTHALASWALLIFGFLCVSLHFQ